MKLAHVRRLSTGTLFCSYCHSVLAHAGELADHEHDPSVPEQYGGRQVSIDDVLGEQ